MSSGTERTPDAVAHAFAEQFANWGLRLPEHRQEIGTITGGGWVVNYRYLREEGEERLYYFASHRMTNDCLVCIYPDGRSETVDECQEARDGRDSDQRLPPQRRTRRWSRINPSAALGGSDG